VEVGTGYASPVVVGNQVFLLSRQGDDEVVRALRLADGKELWSQRYAAPFRMSPYATSHGKGPKSTPVVAGSRLYTLGIGNILSCWETKEGKRLWQVDFAKTYPKGSSLWYGAASSPDFEAGMLIAQLGGREEGALAALDGRSGVVQWKWEGDGAAYASPITTTLGGVRQIITQSRTACIGVSAGSGSLLWRLPFETEYDQNIITPVIAGDLVIFAGLHQPTAAYRVKEIGGKWSAEKVWENPDITLYMSTPVLVGNRLVGLANRQKGRFFAIDVVTGKIAWTSDGRMGDYATLLATKDLVLAQTGGGELFVFPPGAERFAPVARYRLSDKPTWAHPAVVGNQILVKDQTSLTLWSI
jgi:outer membrane protein assembly factor BamB